MTINKIKKEIRKEIEELGDKIRFEKYDEEKLIAVITRQDGRKDRVYYKLENGELVSDWYYPM